VHDLVAEDHHAEQDGRDHHREHHLDAEEHQHEGSRQHQERQHVPHVSAPLAVW
jgi:hypothetical protein